MLTLLILILVLAGVLYAATNHPLLSVTLLASTILILVLGTALGVAHSALVL